VTESPTRVRGRRPPQGEPVIDRALERGHGLRQVALPYMGDVPEKQVDPRRSTGVATPDV
jgi:hypothetical protein